MSVLHRFALWVAERFPHVVADFLYHNDISVHEWNKVIDA